MCWDCLTYWPIHSSVNQWSETTHLLMRLICLQATARDQKTSSCHLIERSWDFEKNGISDLNTINTLISQSHQSFYYYLMLKYIWFRKKLSTKHKCVPAVIHESEWIWPLLFWYKATDWVLIHNVVNMLWIQITSFYIYTTWKIKCIFFEWKGIFWHFLRHLVHSDETSDTFWTKL